MIGPPIQWVVRSPTGGSDRRSWGILDVRSGHDPGSNVDQRDIGYGNAGAMETTERFPQRLGNLAQNARFPHSHSRSLFVSQEEDEEDEDARCVTHDS